MESLITNLGIDWKLLLAQAINFGILVYVLKRFVYAPVLEVLEKRRREIAETKVKEELADTRLTDIESEKQSILTSARKEAQAIVVRAETSAKSLLDEGVKRTEDQVEKILKEGEEVLAAERAQIRAEIKNEIGSVVAAAVEKTVGDFISKESEERLKEEALKLIRENAEIFK